MKSKLLRFTLFVLISTVSVTVNRAQDAQPSNIVVVDSWSKGSETVPEQIVSITIDSSQRDFATEIVSGSGKRYKLSLVHKVSKLIPIERWVLELREVILWEGKETVGDNLVLGGRPAPGADYFPREDLVGDLYPKEKPNTVIDGLAFYPISTVRKIRIEGFYLVAKVLSYQVSLQDKNKIATLDVVVEFQKAHDANGLAVSSKVR